MAKVSYTKDQIAVMPVVRMTFMYLEIENGKPYHIWLDQDGKICTYAGARNIAQAAPGMIYTFPQPREESILSTEGKYAGNHEDKTSVTRWAAIHRANRERLASIRRISAEAGEDRLQQYIDPLASAYARMNAPQQAQFIAWIVRKIVKADL